MTRLRLPMAMAGWIALASPALADPFSLAMPALAGGQRLPEAQVLNGFGCHGGDRSPELIWTKPPAGTKSLAVTVYDPDAPTGSGWWHWVVFNIPPNVTRLPAGAGDGAGLPAGAVQGRNDFGASAYGGACPPPGPAHRYQFTVYALKVDRLDLGPDSSGALVGYQIRASQLASAEVTALYGR